MQIRFLERLKGLRDDERGMTTVEYVIVLCLIAAVSVGLWQEFGSQLAGHLEGASGDINDQLSKGP